MDPIVEMQLPYEFVSFICQSPRPSLDEYRIVVKDMLIYHLGESPEHLEEQGVAVIDALDPSCPLPRCANNPIPRSLPWLDLRRKGPALV
jgi:hypothetical protein